MGTYDDLICHAELPVRDAPTHGYQTKSLDCAADLYVIAPAGELFYWSPLSRRWIPLSGFSGTVTFYRPWRHDGAGWVAFSAAFRAGIMTAVYVDHLTKE